MRFGDLVFAYPRYCHRYRIVARSQNSADTGTSNLGFRCARSGDGSEEAVAAEGAPAVAHAPRDEL